ncbi:MAG: nicotinate-nucleotide--dimethylbenzimidazole phosphoribosyltransferase [Gammaproteobacteria bacterium]|nr:nicotinate-nucleotide--dimethylbenzimidazole phosphoribosyltransferase [Gammaproteobacteria bacterium]MXW46689.1 nicotinate-nucleotide--dimethylbenzimidazole phosphoribosyltransferase [Gammaproteobacteria bacterium]MYD00971.1 nicotinate-nucleotide--dimethylbenzimidazole phosphoribosyltransferase [Gammaproteobacteria bacterium]MYI24519.1 nicotinate-nucleotide--dimethylbenzimidazole phosphoribosyltransferase [Gammaproteobacteria bacterium]
MAANDGSLTGQSPPAAAPDFDRAVREAIDSKTKPVGALGRLEDLAAQLARVQQTLAPRAARCKLTVFAGDHGIATAGVSAYPPEVTRQMLLNFLAGGAAANVMARALGVDFTVVDAGVMGPAVEHPRLDSRRIAPGTLNFLEQPAMPVEQCESALRAGREIGSGGDHEVACFGEMGIGNTSSASLVAAKILGLPLDGLVGLGTGLDAAGLARKQRVLETAAARTPAELDPSAALREYGGFESVMLAGAVLGAAHAGKLVLVDGFIATVSALAAARLSPEVMGNLVFAHRSAETGHSVVLEALGASPLLDLGIRLGEGAGALLAWPLVRAAAAMLRDMASFESAGVSGRT